MLAEHLNFFSKFIEKELGIVYSEKNYYQLEARLEEIAKIFGLPDIAAVYNKAKEGITGSFKQLILDTATNNETSFFRDTRAFQAIEKIILPEIISKVPPEEPLRVWSAASSCGQEPYSITMMFKELQQKSSFPKFKITATDISERVLERAKKGCYSQLEIQRGLSAQYMIKYFQKDTQDQWTINPEIRDLVEFKQKNLKENFNFIYKFHLILCRNVLLYQSIESKIDIINRISKCLTPNGYLILGAGESLVGLSNPFEQILADGMVVYRLT